LGIQESSESQNRWEETKILGNSRIFREFQNLQESPNPRKTQRTFRKSQRKSPTHLKALVSDSGVDEEFEPFDTTGSPLSFADEMSFSLFDRKLATWTLFSGISPDVVGVIASVSPAESSRSSEMLFW
jgi:hypothetical protein